VHEERELEPIGARLKRLREARNLSQRQIAEPGISAAYISRIEAGQRQPSVSAVRLLARRLDVSPDYLETGRSIGPAQEAELRLADAELALRLSDEPNEAEPVFREVLASAESLPDDALIARARLGLGLLAFRRGEHDRAIAELEQARDTGKLSPDTHPDLYATLGRAYVSSGRAYKSVQLFQSALDYVAAYAPENAPARIRFATYLSYALSDMGELAAAQEVLADGLAQAEDLVDPYSRVRLHWAQARLAAATPEPLAGLVHLRRAISLLETIDDKRHLGRAHLLSAEILLLNDDADSARPHLELAEELLGGHPDAEDRYWLLAEKARFAARSDDSERAVALARNAIDVIGETDAAERGTAYGALGEGLFGLGEVDGGDEAFREAVELLSGERLWHEAAGACRTWARLLRAAGREDAAFDVLEQGTSFAARSSRTPKARPARACARSAH
jgi:transcriptional regulator with XRE-family HTH domain